MCQSKSIYEYISGGLRLATVSLCVSVFTICAQTSAAQYPSPSCYYTMQEDPSIQEVIPNREATKLGDNCQICKYSDNCIPELSSGHNISHPVKYIKSSDSSYINVTLNFLPPADSFLIQEFPRNTCWSMKTRSIEHPSTLIVSYLPVRSDLSFITAARVMESVEAGGPSCDFKSCSLKDAGVYVEPIATKKCIKLKLMVVDEGDYRVEILSGICNVTCTGNLSDCNILTFNETVHLNPKETFEKNYDVTVDLYHCIRILPVFGGCSGINTRPIKLAALTPDRGVFDPVERKDNATYVILAVIVGVLSLVIFLVAVFSKLKMNILYTFHPRPVNQEVDESVETLVTDNMVLDHKDVQVYLIYCNESKEFLKLMTSFRNLLSRYVDKVWDPFALEDEGVISNNINNWILRSLEDPKMRIVLVETENSVQLRRQGDQHRLFNQHYLNREFLFALTSMERKIDMSNDYSRVFIVRLTTFSQNSKFDITRCTRYQMPEYFASLVSHIRYSTNKIHYQDLTKKCFLSKEHEDFNLQLSQFISSSHFI